MYTDDARRVRSVAPRHAKRLHRDAVGIEHLLLALIEYGRGPVEEAFFAIGITPGEVAAQLESRGENGRGPYGRRRTDRASLHARRKSRIGTDPGREASPRP